MASKEYPINKVIWVKGVNQKETDDIMELVAVFDTIIQESFLKRHGK